MCGWSFFILLPRLTTGPGGKCFFSCLRISLGGKDSSGRACGYDIPHWLFLGGLDVSECLQGQRHHHGRTREKKKT